MESLPEIVSGLEASSRSDSQHLERGARFWRPRFEGLLQGMKEGHIGARIGQLLGAMGRLLQSDMASFDGRVSARDQAREAERIAKAQKSSNRVSKTVRGRGFEV